MKTNQKYNDLVESIKIVNLLIPIFQHFYISSCNEDLIKKKYKLHSRFSKKFIIIFVWRIVFLIKKKKEMAVSWFFVFWRLFRGTRSEH